MQYVCNRSLYTTRPHLIIACCTLCDSTYETATLDQTQVIDIIINGVLILVVLVLSLILLVIMWDRDRTTQFHCKKGAVTFREKSRARYS